jgi:hypothetical protein
MKKLLAVAVAFPVVGFVCFMAGAMWSGGLTVQAEGDGHGAGTASGNGDVNGDKKIDVSDVIYTLNWLFGDGPSPTPIECPPAGLPVTGQTKCFDDAWAEIPCDSADFPGQDGFYRAGCRGEGRFVDNLDGTVTDTCTGLMWQQDTVDPNRTGTYDENDGLTWQGALKYCEGLSFAGHDDWRLPNVRELRSILDYGRRIPCIDPIFGAESRWYWSSTTNADVTDSAWLADFAGGLVHRLGKENTLLIRAVRGGL